MAQLDLAGVVGILIGIIDQLVPILITLALVYFMWGAIKYIMAAGETNTQARSAIVWGLVALFVITSVWGIIHIACLTLLHEASCHV